MNNNNNQELTNAILDFDTVHNNLNTLVNSIIEYCTLSNVANINNETLTVHTPHIAEYLANDDMVLSGDESLDSDMQSRINVQNIHPNVQQNVVQPIANIQQNNIQPRQSRRLQGLAPENNGLPQNGRSM